MRPRAGPALIACLLLAAAGACSDGDGGGTGLDGTFQEETVASGFTRATAFAFTPDGRILVAEQGGAVSVIKDGAVLDQPFIELEVNRHHERGLLGIAVDPDFTSNGYVYLYYVVENSPDVSDGPKTAQLIRVTADGDVAATGSELVLLGSVVGDAERPSCYDQPAGVDCIPADAASHNGGGIGFTADGKLLIALGDAEQFLPAQDLDYLGGKLVRINRDGSAPEDNPFYDGPDAARSRVWALGLRNPFTLAMRPGTDIAYIGDVGSFYEEIDLSARGANYGWPCFSGPQPEIEDPVCDELRAQDGHTPALYAYERTEDGAAVIVAGFYQGDNYPDELDGAFLFGDFIQGTISALRVDEDDNLIDDTVEVIYEAADAPVDFAFAPDGDLYYLSINLGAVQHLCFAAGDDEGCP